MTPWKDSMTPLDKIIKHHLALRFHHREYQSMQPAIRIGILVSIGLLMPINSWAYLDPGTGSLLLQGVLGAIAVIGATIKLYWHRLSAFIFGRKIKEEHLATNQPESENNRE